MERVCQRLDQGEDGAEKVSSSGKREGVDGVAVGVCDVQRQAMDTTKLAAPCDGSECRIVIKGALTQKAADGIRRIIAVFSSGEH